MNRKQLNPSPITQPSFNPSISTLGLDDPRRIESELGTTTAIQSNNANKQNGLAAKDNDYLGDTQIIDQKFNKLPEHLKALLIDLSIDEPDIEFLFEKDGIGCISLGDIVAIKGKAKAGKSTLLICLIAALLKGEYMGFKALKKDCNVRYVDTEQNRANTFRFTKKVHTICGYKTNTNKETFRTLNLRGKTPDQRSKSINEIFEYLKPALLIIDGAKDLIINGDINSPTASGEVVQQLMTLSNNYHVSIITVLHENKGDNNLRGHIGTELLNKCSECWQVTKAGDVFEVEQTDNRNEPVEGFSFILNSEKLPVAIAYAPKIAPAERLKQNKISTFRQCLPQLTRKRYNELVTLYCEYGGCKDSTALKHIKDALNWGYLIKDDSGLYKFNYLKT